MIVVKCSSNCRPGVIAAIALASLTSGCATEARLTDKSRVGQKAEEVVGRADPDQVISFTVGKKISRCLTSSPRKDMPLQRVIWAWAHTQLSGTSGADARPVRRQTRGLFLRNMRRWPLGIVKYKISGNLPNRISVTQAIDHWQQVTAIRFVRARSTDRDFVEFDRSTEPLNCYVSETGYTGSPQYVYLGIAAPLATLNMRSDTCWVSLMSICVLIN